MQIGSFFRNDNNSRFCHAVPSGVLHGLVSCQRNILPRFFAISNRNRRGPCPSRDYRFAGPQLIVVYNDDRKEKQSPCVLGIQLLQEALERFRPLIGANANGNMFGFGPHRKQRRPSNQSRTASSPAWSRKLAGSSYIARRHWYTSGKTKDLSPVRNSYSSLLTGCVSTSTIYSFASDKID